jgi:cell division septation protein DedD
VRRRADVDARQHRPVVASTLDERFSAADATTSTVGRARADRRPRRHATAPRSAPEPPPSSAKAPAARSEGAARGIWTIQLAAYNYAPDAEQLVRKLARAAWKARISGDAKPFRVRLDYYDTRQQPRPRRGAQAAAASSAS